MGYLISWGQVTSSGVCFWCPNFFCWLYCHTRWSQTFVIFILCWGNDPIWLACYHIQRDVFFPTTWLCHQICARLLSSPTTHPCMVWYQFCLLVHFYHKNQLKNVGEYTIFLDGMGIPNLHFTTWVGGIFSKGQNHTLRQEPENSLGWTQSWVGAFRSKRWWRGDRRPRDRDP